MILITGSTGFVGMNLLKKLSENKNQIVAMYRSEEKKKLVEHFFIDTGSNFENIIWRKSNINDFVGLNEVFIGITKVYHCAGFISFSIDDNHKLYEINKRGTENIVNLCIEKKISKLVYISSISALGEEVNKLSIDENSIWNNSNEQTFYSYSKYLAELEVWRGIEEGLKAVIINPGIIMGKCIRKDTPQSKIEKIIIELPVCLYTNGKSGFVNISDVVEISTKLMKSDISNERFILVSKNYDYKTIIKKLKNSLKISKPEISIKKEFLYIILFFDFIFSSLRLKKKYLSFNLIITMFSKKIYNGNKIIKFLPYFKYDKI